MVTYGKNRKNKPHIDLVARLRQINNDTFWHLSIDVLAIFLGGKQKTKESQISGQKSGSGR